MSKSKIIAVDFDNCLCFSDYPFIKEPNQPVIDYVKDQKAKGAKIILWTCRSGRQLRYAMEWCREQGLKFDAVNSNLRSVVQKYKIDSRKIYADEYIDDRSIRPSELSKIMEESNDS